MTMSEIKGRIFKGCGVLGKFWQEGERCAEGWRAASCACPTRSKFCMAKKQWVDLAVEDGRVVEEGDYGIPLMMKASEWDATGLTLKVELPEVGVVGIGPKGVISMMELAKVDAETAPSILRIFKNFPDSQITGSVFPEKAPAKPLDSKN